VRTLSEFYFRLCLYPVIRTELVGRKFKRAPPLSVQIRRLGIDSLRNRGCDHSKSSARRPVQSPSHPRPTAPHREPGLRRGLSAHRVPQSGLEQLSHRIVGWLETEIAVACSPGVEADSDWETADGRRVRRDMRATPSSGVGLRGVRWSALVERGPIAPERRKRSARAWRLPSGSHQILRP